MFALYRIVEITVKSSIQMVGSFFYCCACIFYVNIFSHVFISSFKTHQLLCSEVGLGTVVSPSVV